MSASAVGFYYVCLLLTSWQWQGVQALPCDRDVTSGSFNDADIILAVGKPAIKKVKQIELFEGKSGVGNLLKSTGKMDVMYQLVDDSEYTICHGTQDGNANDLLNIADSDFLQYVEVRLVLATRYVKLITKNGVEINCCGGGKETDTFDFLGTENHIVNFQGEATVLDTVPGVTQRTLVILPAALRAIPTPSPTPPPTDPPLNLIKTVFIGTSFRFTEFSKDFVGDIPFSSGVDATNTVTNVNGEIEQQQTLTISTSEVRSETVVVSEGSTQDSAIEVTGTVGVPEVASGSLAVSTGFGFSESLSESTTITKVDTIVRSLQVTALPGTRVTAIGSFTRADYEFEWEADALQFFTDDPETGIPITLSGTLVGDNIAEASVTIFTTDLDGNPVPNAPNAPVPAPSPPVPAPSPPPSPGCFSQDATVQVRNKGLVTMKDLQIGDLASTGSQTFQPVYAFAHFHPTLLSEFLRIETRGAQSTDNKSPLEITNDHLVFLEGKDNPVPAGMVKVGDVLQGSNGGSIVTNIGSVQREGVYAPLTPEGTLLVDGIKVSSYVTLQDDTKEFVELQGGIATLSQHQFVHLTLSPFRIMCMATSAMFCHDYDDNGMPHYVAWGVQLVKWLDGFPMLVQVVLLSIAVFTFGFFVTAEAILVSIYGHVVIVTAISIFGAAFFKTFNIKSKKI